MYPSLVAVAALQDLPYDQVCILPCLPEPEPTGNSFWFCHFQETSCVANAKDARPASPSQRYSSGGAVPHLLSQLRIIPIESEVTHGIPLI